MPSFTDWLARNLFISEEQERVSAEVAANQQAILDRQLREGKVDLVEYIDTSEDIADTGTTFFDKELGKRGVPALLATVPWWVWVLGAIAIAIYLGPVLRPVLKRLVK